ncbi:MAG: M48 family metallopeptidase [Planctomycetota bacterium]|jgi:predicted Zn-dependent protease
MKGYMKSRVVVLLGLLLLQAGCSQVPITGRQQLNLVPDSLINSMAFQSYGEFISTHKLSDNAEQTQMVKRVGVRIQKAVEQYSLENYKQAQLRGYKWEFNLIEDANVNAWAMPGGKIVVYTGLLPVTRNDAGLAVVMAHEIAHAFAKHGSERMSQGLLVQFGGMALSKAVSQYPDKTQDLFMRSFGIGAQVGVLLPYSRVHESEADHLGLIFMAMAGYDPHEAVGFWQRMADSSKGPRPPELLSTHPAPATRIANIQKLIPEAMRHYRPQ